MRLYERLRIDESGIGTKWGYRTQIGAAFFVQAYSKKKERVAVYECNCGRVLLIPVRQAKYKPNQKCNGCKLITHGMWKSPEYSAWEAMIQRCTNPKATKFENYGGRGISVCERWLNSFSAFHEDVGNRPSDKHSIDRIDNDGNYEPGNVRWATAKEQCRNVRKNLIYEFQGQQRTLAEISELSGVNYELLYGRVRLADWDIARAVATPKKEFRRTCKPRD